MKGRNRFNKTETNELKRLIKAKESATPDKQKGIRNLIRKIGFYYSDFKSQKLGYTLYDFEALIKSGEVTISDNSENPTSKTLKFKSYDLLPRNQNNSNSTPSVTYKPIYIQPLHVNYTPPYNPPPIQLPQSQQNTIPNTAAENQTTMQSLDNNLQNIENQSSLQNQMIQTNYQLQEINNALRY